MTDLDIIVTEYLSKCEDCDSCCAEYFCIENKLKKSRVPTNECKENMKKYLEWRANNDS